MKKESVIQLSTIIDHLTGEELGMALTSLNNMSEILDAVYLSGIGKKNRPSGLLQVLCLPQNELQTVNAIFRHTHTLGIRRQELERYITERRSIMLNIDEDNILAKEYIIDGETYSRYEADKLKELADKKGIGMPALRLNKN